MIRKLRVMTAYS